MGAKGRGDGHTNPRPHDRRHADPRLAWTGTFEFEGGALTMKAKTYVGVQNGLPLREEMTTPKATSTLD
jgi:hypothetical protein